MDNICSESILEVFDFNKKKIFCSCVEEQLLNGLINRGSEVWVDDSNKTKISAMETYLDFKDEINFTANNLPNYFDYSIVSDLKINFKSASNGSLAKEQILIITGMLNLFIWNMKLKKKLIKNNIVVYSVVPSLKNVKLIVPELFNVPLERYWTLNSRNLTMSLKLILEWIFIKNNLIRRLFADKLIVIKW